MFCRAMLSGWRAGAAGQDIERELRVWERTRVLQTAGGWSDSGWGQTVTAIRTRHLQIRQPRWLDEGWEDKIICTDKLSIVKNN